MKKDTLTDPHAVLAKLDSIEDRSAQLDELRKLGIPIASLTAAFGMMTLCSDDMQENQISSDERDTIHALLFHIEDEIKKVRLMLLKSDFDHGFGKKAA
jgi:hypothetical protein